jgi:hypothetical protein
MNEMLLIYLVTRLDALIYVGTALMTIGGIAFVICSVSLCLGYDNLSDSGIAKHWRTAKLSAVLFLVPMIVGIFVPTTKQASAMIAGSILMDVAKSEKARTLSDKSIQVFEQYLDSLLKEKK